MTSALFQPIALRGLTLDNRITVAPMCQYSAVDGVVGDWHRQHWGSLALSGAGLFVIEATAVEPAGRITPGDSGLWNDAQERAMAELIRATRSFAPAKFGLQIAHAGRKASSHLPWRGGKGLDASDGAWTTFAPSAEPFADGRPAPEGLDKAGLERIKNGFVATTRRALAAGLDLIEMHAAHGYLLHSFTSALSNHREDEYGGSLENRLRFPLEVFAAMRAVWPSDKPLGARITGTDWLEGGITIDDAVAFAGELKALGCDFVCVSSGGLAPARIPVGPGYQVPLAEEIRRRAGVVTRAVGMITDPRQAEAIIAEGKADMVALARAMLDNPRWGLHAAAALGVEPRYPLQYERANAASWPGYGEVHKAA